MRAKDVPPGWYRNDRPDSDDDGHVTLSPGLDYQGQKNSITSRTGPNGPL